MPHARISRRGSSTKQRMSRRDSPPEGPWSAYLDGFHASHPGITERVLSRCRADGLDPYEWVSEALAGDDLVLDLASGSAPLAATDPRRGWVAIDRSRSELAFASQRLPGRVVQADARSMPVRDRVIDAVAASMALMAVPSAERVLGEIERVLRADGILVALLPATRPLRSQDRMRYARLLSAIRRVRLPFAEANMVRAPERALTASGFRVVELLHKRFTFRLADADDADAFADSLYLPGSLAGRRHAVRAVVRSWRGKALAVPLQRVIAVRHA